MNTVTVELIDHKEQPHNTVGSWSYDKLGHLSIKVSLFTYTDCHSLVTLHEYIEATMCRLNGITQEQVAAWNSHHDDHFDPGSIPGCPYYREHMFARMCERSLAAELNIDWDIYEAAVEKLVGDL